MTSPLTPKEISEAYHLPAPHESSAERLWKRWCWTLILLCGLVILEMCRGYYQNEIDKPLPPPITEKQRAMVKQLETRFSLAGWCWSVEPSGKTVELYDPKIKARRRVN